MIPPSKIVLKKINKILYGILLFLQAAGITALFVAEELTHKKAGVNHHLYYRRAQFNSTVLTEDRIMILTVVLILAIAGLCFFLWKKKSNGKLLTATCILEIMWMVVTVAACYMDLFRSSYSYPYIMVVLALCILLTGIQILIARKE